MKKYISFILLLSVVQTVSAGNSETPELVVGVAPFPPCVIVKEQPDSSIAVSGYSIELFEADVEEIPEPQRFTYRYVKIPFGEFMDKLENGEVDIVVAGITKNKERELRVDFTDTTLRSGLRCAVLGEMKPPALYKIIIDKFFTKDVGGSLLGIYICIIVAGFLIYVCDWRAKGKTEMHVTDEWPQGFEQGMDLAQAAGTTMGFGNRVAKRFFTKYILLPLVFFVMAALLAIPIGAVVSAWTYRDQIVIKSEIKSLDDLRGKMVATEPNTTSADYLENKLGAIVRHVSAIEFGFDLLHKKEVAAVFFDSPCILDNIKNDTTGKVITIGGLVEPQDYGFAVQQGSPYREILNRAQHSLGEKRKKIHDKWFLDK